MFPFHLFSVYVIFSSGGPPAHVLCSIPPSSPPSPSSPSWMPWTPRWTPLLLASLESRSPACWLSCCVQTVCVCLERLACPEIFITASSPPLLPHGVSCSPTLHCSLDPWAPRCVISQSPSPSSALLRALWPQFSHLFAIQERPSLLSPWPPLKVLCLLEVNPCPPAFPWDLASCSRLSLGLWGSRSWIFPSFLGLLWTPSGWCDSGHSVEIHLHVHFLCLSLTCFPLPLPRKCFLFHQGWLDFISVSKFLSTYCNAFVGFLPVFIFTVNPSPSPLFLHITSLALNLLSVC